jgi:hypothetical protein
LARQDIVDLSLCRFVEPIVCRKSNGLMTITAPRERFERKQYRNGEDVVEQLHMFSRLIYDESGLPVNTVKRPLFAGTAPPSQQHQQMPLHSFRATVSFVVVHHYLRPVMTEQTRICNIPFSPSRSPLLPCHNMAHEKTVFIASFMRSTEAVANLARSTSSGKTSDSD